MTSVESAKHTRKNSRRSNYGPMIQKGINNRKHLQQHLHNTVRQKLAYQMLIQAREHHRVQEMDQYTQGKRNRVAAKRKYIKERSQCCMGMKEKKKKKDFFQVLQKMYQDLNAFSMEKEKKRGKHLKCLSVFKI